MKEPKKVDLFRLHIEILHCFLPCVFVMQCFDWFKVAKVHSSFCSLLFYQLSCLGNIVDMHFTGLNSMYFSKEWFVSVQKSTWLGLKWLVRFRFCLVRFWSIVKLWTPNLTSTWNFKKSSGKKTSWVTLSTWCQYCSITLYELIWVLKLN